MAEQEPVVDPVEQDAVQFHEHEIIAVRLADGRIGVVLRWVCETLNLDAQAQVRRIQRTASITNELVRVRVQTSGGKQTMPTLTLRGFPTWILGINPGEVKGDTEEAEHIRQMIIAYQVEAVDVLYAHFANKMRPALPEPRAAIVQPMIEPGPEASHEEKATYHETMSLWHRWQADYHMQKWRKEVQEKQEVIIEGEKTMGGFIADIQERMGPQRITPEHQGLVQFYVSELSKAKNKHRGTIFTSLHIAFRVPRYEELLESDWARIEQWFKLQFPGQQLPPVQSTWMDGEEE
jgi:hypothetical protein